MLMTSPENDPRNGISKTELGQMDSRCPEIKRAGDLVARWRDLAEQRLEHLIELYQSGRWQKYYNEADFLKQIREVVAAIEAWKQLVPARQAEDVGLRSTTMNVWKDLGGGDVSLAPVWQNGASAVPSSQGDIHGGGPATMPTAAPDAPLAPVAMSRESAVENAMQTKSPSILPKSGSGAADVLNRLADAGNSLNLRT